MAYYQNIFTQVQVRAASPDPGVPIHNEDRSAATFWHLLGRLGNAQIGPIYLGYTGLLSLICGFTAFEIIGLNKPDVRRCDHAGLREEGVGAREKRFVIKHINRRQ